eukprot:260004-Pelagomonas_calceolata.AAC.3
MRRDQVQAKKAVGLTENNLSCLICGLRVLDMMTEIIKISPNQMYTPSLQEREELISRQLSLFADGIGIRDSQAGWVENERSMLLCRCKHTSTWGRCLRRSFKRSQSVQCSTYLRMLAHQKARVVSMHRRIKTELNSIKGKINDLVRICSFEMPVSTNLLGKECEALYFTRVAQGSPEAPTLPHTQPRLQGVYSLVFDLEPQMRLLRGLTGAGSNVAHSARGTLGAADPRPQKKAISGELTDWDFEAGPDAGAAVSKGMVDHDTGKEEDSAVHAVLAWLSEFEFGGAGLGGGTTASPSQEGLADWEESELEDGSDLSRVGCIQCESMCLQRRGPGKNGRHFLVHSARSTSLS